MNDGESLPPKSLSSGVSASNDLMGRRYDTLEMDRTDGVLRITLNRPEQRNSINAAMVAELTGVLTGASRLDNIRVIVLSGCKGYFCTGMDFHEFTANGAMEAETGARTALVDLQHFHAFAALLHLLTSIPKIVIAEVDGLALAGGMGLVAASDVVVSPQSQFGLPEALWGLVPAIVMPFLVRRVGFQTAYRLSLTTLPISAERAQAMSLVDETGSDPRQTIIAMTRRLLRLDPQTIGDIKSYARSLTPIGPGVTEAAVVESARASMDAKVVHNLTRYVKSGIFPWE